MTKHTPGPFTVGEMVRQSIRIEEPERTAALVLVEPGRVRPAEAAAALFAAAPDLLAALKDLLDHTCGTDSFCEWCERHAPKDHEGSITGPIPHVSDCLRLAAERAIAKAEGRG